MLCNLNGQLARGHHDQCSYRTIERLGQEFIHNGQQKSRGLSGTGLGRGDNITTLQNRWDHFFLNGSGGFVVRGFNTL